MLPKLSGLDITKHVRKEERFNSVCILMVTAKAANSDIILGLEAGADDYLVKSQVVIADVVDRIKHHLNLL